MELTIPIAETFFSIQGEGLWTGTPMFFIRMAGCNVGKYETPTRLGDTSNMRPFQVLHPEHSTCTSFNNQQFICDTDYRVKETLTFAQILARIDEQAQGCRHISLTGGEPFIHKEIRPLIDLLLAEIPDCLIHIETSGTWPIGQNLGMQVWLTCSPKRGFLQVNKRHIDQWKFLIRDTEDECAVMKFIKEYDVTQNEIYIQPIDPMQGKMPVKDLEFIVACVKRHPEWKLSLQIHKMLGVS